MATGLAIRRDTVLDRATLPPFQALQRNPRARLGTALVDRCYVLGLDGRHLLLTEVQKRVWERLDGGTVAELAAECGADADGVSRFLEGLLQRGFVLAGPGTAAPAGPESRLGFRASRLTVQLDLPVPACWRRTLSRAGRSVILGRASLSVQAGIAISGVALHLSRSTSQAIGPKSWMAVAGLALGAGVVHELGHALALARYAEPPDRFGIMVRWLVLPGMFVNTSGAWLLDRRRRAIVMGAGPFASILAGAGLELGSAGLGEPVLHVAAGVSFAIGIFNLLPFLTRMDGFWLLSDFLETTDWRRARGGRQSNGYRGWLLVVLWGFQFGFLALLGWRAAGGLLGEAWLPRTVIAISTGAALSLLIAIAVRASASCQRERSSSFRSTLFMWLLTVFRLR